jgi:hypothetical protein
MEDLTINVLDGWSFVEFVESIKYTGYDPTLTRSILKSIEINQDQFRVDVVKLLIVALERGTNQRKMTTKISNDGKDSILFLISKYNIKNGMPSQNSDVTFARIVSAYPIIASRILETRDVRVIGDQGLLPTFLCHTAGASIIPHDNIELFSKWKLWRTNFSKVINSPVSSTDFDKIIHDSRLYTESERKLIISSFGA